MHQGSQVTIKRVVWDLTYLISAVSTSERLTLGLSTFTGLHCSIAGVCRGFLRLLILSFSSSFRLVWSWATVLTTLLIHFRRLNNFFFQNLYFVLLSILAALPWSPSLHGLRLIASLFACMHVLFMLLLFRIIIWLILSIYLIAINYMIDLQTSILILSHLFQASFNSAVILWFPFISYCV